MPNDLSMTLQLVHGAMGHIAKAERILKHKAPNRKDTETQPITKGSEELFQAACDVYAANEKFFHFCKNKSDTDWLDEWANKL